MQGRPVVRDALASPAAGTEALPAGPLASIRAPARGRGLSHQIRK